MTLEELLIDEEETRTDGVSNADLFDVLDRYIEIEPFKQSQSAPELRLKDDFETVSPRLQVLIAVLAAEAIYRLDMREDWFVSTTELFQESGLDEGVHYPYIRNLEQEGLLNRKNPNRYTMMTTRIDEIVDEF